MGLDVYIHLNSSGKSSSTEIFPPFVEHVMPKGRKQDVKPYCTVIDENSLHCLLSSVFIRKSGFLKLVF